MKCRKTFYLILKNLYSIVVIMSDVLEYIPFQAKLMFGHDGIIDNIKKLYKANSMPHSFIFSGYKGIGKSTTASNLSRAILNSNIDYFGDNNRKTFTQNDHLIFANTHPDCLILNKQQGKNKNCNDITIDRVRNVIKFFSQTSITDNWRVAIIDSVDDLTISGSNTLLKILEEPPKKCLLILISHNIHKVLPTIRSRCQVLQFQNLQYQEIKNILIDKNIDTKSVQNISLLPGISPGLIIAISQLGGDSFYKDFLSLIYDFSKNNFSSLYSFYDKYFIAYETFNVSYCFYEFLYHWLSNEITSYHNDNQSNKSQLRWLINRQNVIKSWFEVQDILIDSNIFHLNARQVFITVMHKLFMIQK